MVVVRNEPDTVAVGQGGGVGEEDFVLPDDIACLHVVAVQAVEAGDDENAAVRNRQLVIGWRALFNLP